MQRAYRSMTSGCRGGTVFQEIRPGGAGFETGDFVKEKLEGGYRCRTILLFLKPQLYFPESGQQSRGRSRCSSPAPPRLSHTPSYLLHTGGSFTVSTQRSSIFIELLLTQALARPRVDFCAKKSLYERLVCMRSGAGEGGGSNSQNLPCTY